MTPTPEEFGELLAAHSEAMHRLDKAMGKIDEFQATVNGLVARQIRDDTFVKVGSWVVGIAASLAMTLAGWALARASEITTLEAWRDGDVAIDQRQDLAINALNNDMATVRQDVAATRADIRNMSTLLRSQDANLRALLAEEEETTRPRRR